MLTLFTGRFEDLLPSQQDAIHQLTVRRYVEDIYQLHALIKMQVLTRLYDTSATR